MRRKDRGSRHQGCRDPRPLAGRTGSGLPSPSGLDSPGRCGDRAPRPRLECRSRIVADQLLGVIRLGRKFSARSEAAWRLSSRGACVSHTSHRLDGRLWTGVDGNGPNPDRQTHRTPKDHAHSTSCQGQPCASCCLRKTKAQFAPSVRRISIAIQGRASHNFSQQVLILLNRAAQRVCPNPPSSSPDPDGRRPSS